VAHAVRVAAECIPETWKLPAFRVRRWRGRTARYCVIIPVLDEGERIARLLERMDAHFDIIVVDGGSQDGSLDGDVLADVRGILVKTGNGGLSAQLRCAYAFALEKGYAGVITIDGNDKDDPAAIPRFAAALDEGVDFAQGSRYLPDGRHENTPWMREWAIRCVHVPFLRFASGFAWTDTTQGFRAYSRRLLLHPGVAPFRPVFSKYELLAYLSYRAPRVGCRCVEVPTTRRYPRGPTPTKIDARGLGHLMSCLVRACLGSFDP
jgi:glycosyltransferase involved in cell wall biosynthesis